MSRSIADLNVLVRPASAEAGATTIPAPPARWKTRVLLPGVILLTMLAILGYAARDAVFPATAVRVVPVVVKVVNDASAGSVVAQAPGWVEPDPYALAVSALTDGIVKEVLVLEGARVKAGDVVVRMVDDEAKLALERIDALCQQAQATLAAAQTEWDNPVERRRAVDVGEAMLDEARAELTKLDSDIAVERAKVAELNEEVRRKQQAADARAASEFEVVQAKLRLQGQLALLKSTEAQRPVLEAKAKRLEAELVAAKENLRLRITETKELAAAKAGYQEAHAMLEEAKLRLERMEVVSPMDGIVMRRLAEPGAKLMLNSDMEQSAQAVRLYDPRKLQVRVDVPLADAAKVGVGQEALVAVDVLPERTFKGKVTRIVHEADIQKNTLQVKVAIEDPVEELKPEMLARVRFLAAARGEGGSDTQQRIFAPQRLIRSEHPGHAAAWVVDQGRGVAVMKKVTAGSRKTDGWVEVTEGLQPGDRLISSDTSGLSEGQRVKVMGEDQL
jgi:RND family efflux transporter MFP subunit